MKKRLDIQMYMVDGQPTCCESVSEHRVCPMLRYAFWRSPGGGASDACGWSGDRIPRTAGGHLAVPTSKCPLWGG
jgi:hypothetical protein